MQSNAANGPLNSYTQLTPLILAIQQAMNSAPADSAAPLVVDSSK